VQSKQYYAPLRPDTDLTGQDLLPVETSRFETIESRRESDNSSDQGYATLSLVDSRTASSQLNPTEMCNEVVVAES